MSGISTVASLVRGGQVPKAVRAYITPLDVHNNDAVMPHLTRTFQYFPESIHDNKQTNWQPKVIPGLSHPLYQWVSGGAREIQFTAVFSRDRALTRNAQDINQGQQAFINTDDDERNVDIPSAIAWLRSFEYPEGTADGNVGTAVRPLPPRKLILGLPGTRINQGNPGLCADEMYAIMIGCDASVESFFPDGTPRISKVNHKFAEIIQIGGKVINHDARDRRMGGTGYFLNNDGRSKK